MERKVLGVGCARDTSGSRYARVHTTMMAVNHAAPPPPCGDTARNGCGRRGSPSITARMHRYMHTYVERERGEEGSEKRRSRRTTARERAIKAPASSGFSAARRRATRSAARDARIGFPFPAVFLFPERSDRKTILHNCVASLPPVFCASLNRRSGIERRLG